MYMVFLSISTTFGDGHELDVQRISNTYSAMDIKMGISSRYRFICSNFLKQKSEVMFDVK